MAAEPDGPYHVDRLPKVDERMRELALQARAAASRPNIGRRSRKWCDAWNRNHRCGAIRNVV
jgi:hypothetical protein